MNLAGVAKAQGDNDRAANGYARALKINPRMVKAHNDWASLLLVNKQMPAAIEHLEAALAIDPDYLPARVNLAHALLSAGRTVEAIAGYNWVLAAKADDALAIKAALAWPVIIASHDEIDQVHQRLDQNLTRLETSTLAVADPLQAIGVPAFYLGLRRAERTRFSSTDRAGCCTELRLRVESDRAALRGGQSPDRGRSADQGRLRLKSLSSAHDRQAQRRPHPLVGPRRVRGRCVSRPRAERHDVAGHRAHRRRRGAAVAQFGGPRAARSPNRRSTCCFIPISAWSHKPTIWLTLGWRRCSA